MWMDGIIRDKRRRQRKPVRRRKPEVFTVSARTREKNAERRRRLSALVLLVVVLAGLGWMLHRGVTLAARHLFSENPRYQVRHWDLQSNGPLLSASHIREYSQLGEYENLFALDLSEIRARLHSVPVVRSVKVTRRLPDTLVIRVDERLAVARLGLDDRLSLAVDERGHVLGPGSLRPNLPAIVGLRQPGVRPGLTISDELFIDALRVLAATERPAVQPYVQVRTINVSDPENLDIRLAGGDRVRLARAHIDERLPELVEIMQDARQRGSAVGDINMTGDARIPPVVQYRTSARGVE